MHSGQERLHVLNIEYIHIGACMGYIQDIFIEALMMHPQLSFRRRLALLRAVNKLLWIQNDLFAKWRVRDGEEFADQMSTYSHGSREGYLGDKKILGSSTGSSVDDDQSSIAESVAPSTDSAATSTHTMYTTQTAQSPTSQVSVCPFAFMAKASSITTKIWAN